MDMDESWNPEPPPEIMKINKEDLIGDTLFSKHWLFEVLLKLIKVCDSIQLLLKINYFVQIEI